MMVTFANNHDNLEAIIRNRAYVIYPPEGPRPPTAEEVRGLAQRRQQGEGKQAEGHDSRQRGAGWVAARGGGAQRGGRFGDSEEGVGRSRRQKAEEKQDATRE
ncbi:unnamed protein product [Closterium sp. NIES-64]|nr:unnamed protein product [Closterium sp. NIES-64]